METASERTAVRVLTREETGTWHGPFSLELRERRRARIVEACVESCRRGGYTRYVLYDADETLLCSGTVE